MHLFISDLESAQIKNNLNKYQSYRLKAFNLEHVFKTVNLKFPIFDIFSILD